MKLKGHVKAVSQRNRNNRCCAVYSVTNSRGFTPSTDYFSKEIYSKDLSTYKLVEKGMIAYNPSRINVGSVALQDKAECVIVSPLYVVFCVDETLLCPEYVTYFLKSEPGLRQIDFRSIGTVRNNFTFDALEKMELRVPSVGDQLHVVSIIRRVESVIESTKQKSNQLDDLVKSRFVEMFGALEPSVSISDACIEFIDGDWIESKDQSESGIRLIQTGNIGNGDFRDKRNRARYISEQTFEQLKCHEVYANDVLISRLPDPVGRACIIPSDAGRSITAVDCSIVRLKKEWEPSFFVSYTMTKQYEHQIQSYLTGTTRKRISRSNLGKIKIPAASFALQQEFAAFVSQVDKLRFEACYAMYFLWAALTLL